MSELGESVSQAVTFLRGFFGDVSKVVAVVEEGMAGAKLASPWGSGSFWNNSYSYAMPSRWMPRFVARQYIAAPPDGAKTGRSAAWYAFFVVHFAPKRAPEPIALWGVAAFDSVHDVWESFDQLILQGAGGIKSPDQSTASEWQSVAGLGYSLRSIQYRQVPVVELRDEKTVNELVVQPLIALVDAVRSESPRT